MRTPALIVPALVREHRNDLERNAEAARLANATRGAYPPASRRGRRGRTFGRVRHRTRLVFGF
ncbi:MAG TPA: hypothetical protein VH395_04745 [Jatrophihabitantaceae bacterium]|jgi:hypothetical protein